MSGDVYDDEEALSAERLQFADAMDQALAGSETVVTVIIEMLDEMAKGKYPTPADIKRRRAACASYLNGLREQRHVIRMQIEKAGTIHG